MNKAKLLTTIIEMDDGDPRIGSLTEMLVSGESTAGCRNESFRLLTATAFAQKLNVSRSTVHRMEKDGRVKRVEILPNSYRYPESQLPEIVAGG